jgi:uncharacterized repeat protein (TIGR03806 family)
MNRSPAIRSAAARMTTPLAAITVGVLIAALCGCQEDGRPGAAQPRADGAAQADASALPAMPARANGHVPPLLSQTGAFTDTPSLAAASVLVPFTVNCALWSDAALKQRWLALPRGTQIHFTPTGEWTFPAGTVFVKHFALSSDERDPAQLRWLETRLLVRDLKGGVYGVTYRWRADRSDADLLPDGADEEVRVRTADGGTRVQRWHYPSRAECLQCHNPVAGFVLGVKTRQLNRDTGEHAGAGNQLLALAGRGMFDHPPAAGELAAMPRLVALDDPHASVEERARSYLDANCAHCHRPGMVGFANFDARYDTPLAEQNLIHGRVIIDHGIDRARNIMPRDPWRSMVLVRLETSDELKMPPLARALVDHAAAALLRSWIDELPGKPALPPPRLAPPPGRFAIAMLVTAIDDDPMAVLHYTTDGSLPDEDAPVYHDGIWLDSPTTLRVKALRSGFSSSVVVNGIYLVEPARP